MSRTMHAHAPVFAPCPALLHEWLGCANAVRPVHCSMCRMACRLFGSSGDHNGGMPAGRSPLAGAPGPLSPLGGSAPLQSRGRMMNAAGFTPAGSVRTGHTQTVHSPVLFHCQSANSQGCFCCWYNVVSVLTREAAVVGLLRSHPVPKMQLHAWFRAAGRLRRSGRLPGWRACAAAPQDCYFSARRAQRRRHAR